jgi:hypothetical protein
MAGRGLISKVLINKQPARVRDFEISGRVSKRGFGCVRFEAES